jgi:phytoene synthase
LPPLERLAASYAPVATRPLWIGYFALEQRLADAARDGRDAIMIQLRLAWWRDRLAEDATRWPKGEPLLAALGPGMPSAPRCRRWSMAMKRCTWARRAQRRSMKPASA